MEKYVRKESEMVWRTPMPGIHFTTLSYVEDKFVLALLRFDAGFTHPAETHDVDEYVYMLKGKSETTIGNDKYLLGPGDYFVIPANTSHSVLILEDTELLGMISPPRPDLR
jgi:quercetin dioxygenase-like cupin family protein